MNFILIIAIINAKDQISDYQKQHTDKWNTYKSSLPLCHLYYCSISGTVIEWTCIEILTIKSLHKIEVKYHINKRLLTDKQQIEQ